MRDEALTKVAEEWEQEKECLIRRACEDKNRAMETAKELHEKKLRADFEVFLANVRQQHDENTRKSVEETWKQAEKMKEAAVLSAREEERLEAERQARIVADTTRQQTEELIAQMEEEKIQALEQQRQQLEYEHQQETEALTNELHEKFDQKLADVCEQYDSEVLATQMLLNEKCSENVQLKEELEDMTTQRDNWIAKHQELRQEYSRFIDQFPGFRGEFLLK